MKRFVLSVAAAFVAAAALAQGTTGRQRRRPRRAVKIGVINVERLVQESALGKEAFSRVKKLNDQKKEEGDKLQKELRDMEQKLADQGSALADDKREALQKSYQEKAIAFKRFQDDANRDLEAAQKKELSRARAARVPGDQPGRQGEGLTRSSSTSSSPASSTPTTPSTSPTTC